MKIEIPSTEEFRGWTNPSLVLVALRAVRELGRRGNKTKAEAELNEMFQRITSLQRLADDIASRVEG